ncbi:GNAT family N-acetyltransferase [Enterovibrio sp. ZSDZ35]|uniref:GNAT family N-acetyltransferase n=1 Tax=Enterovibrio qingdaonensis TaxID=2899818 RepID=A0ABT5QHJ6_9GAMM|nr:GNAT family N-acetyltransferase [Enterovibrio sp. ZSDZ35]MDD1780119.1 GNAT family N-acetyltransferase [Enterovibrio sp. ZSDZ35]
MTKDEELQCQTITSIGDVTPDDWHALVNSHYPFLRHEFLLALEQTNAVGTKSGWVPQYLVVYRGDTLIAAAPCFIKTHPYGEYVFDWAWAEAYEDAGLEYYPKLICAVPFTPATGPRLLCRQDEDWHQMSLFLANAMKSVVEQTACSGTHILFPERTVCGQLAPLGYLERRAVQFHWRNKNYDSFEDFLAQMTARKRKNIRKERQRIDQQQIQVDVLEGEEITSTHWGVFSRFYTNTYLKRSGHTGYLNADLFHQIGETMRDALVMVLARQHDQYIAGALYFKSDDTLYGRYWGCTQEFDNLHFELCYYRGIDYCIQHGLKTFDAGAQGEHKLLRGFEPVITYSAHYLQHQGFHQAIADYLQREHKLIEGYVEDAIAHLPYRQSINT